MGKSIKNVEIVTQTIESKQVKVYGKFHLGWSRPRNPILLLQRSVITRQPKYGGKNLIMKPNWLLSLWLILYFRKICISKHHEELKLWKRNSKVWMLSWSEVRKRMWSLKHQSKLLWAWTLGNQEPYPRTTFYYYLWLLNSIPFIF